MAPPQAAFAAALETAARKPIPARIRRLGMLRGTCRRFILKISRWPARARLVTPAWDHFVLEMRPGLYRAADALDPTGAARELADSLYADLYGVDQRGSARQSLLRYFHGRSSLSTWLRAVLAQRHVDRIRVDRRTEPLPEELPSRARPHPPIPIARLRRRAAFGAPDGRGTPRTARPASSGLLLRAS